LKPEIHAFVILTVNELLILEVVAKPLRGDPTEGVIEGCRHRIAAIP
jgi:hypothetical protein